MNIFKSAWEHTLLYKMSDFNESLYYYLKDRSIIKDTLYSKAFSIVIKKYLNTDLKSDWLGRLYGVVNPNIDAKGDFNINNVIMEIDGDNTNSDEYVKTWVYKQMQMIGQLFKINKLYDYIDIEFEHVGPESQDNYLIIFDIASRKAFAESAKKFSIHFGIDLVIAAIIALIVVIIL